MAPRWPSLVLIVLPAILILASSCGSNAPREWEDSELGGDTATVRNFDYAELTAKVRGVFPPCQHSEEESQMIDLPCFLADLCPIREFSQVMRRQHRRLDERALA
jgi:hypothetical protein